jgi:hypothetical protein
VAPETKGIGHPAVLSVRGDITGVAAHNALPHDIVGATKLHKVIPLVSQYSPSLVGVRSKRVSDNGEAVTATLRDEMLADHRNALEEAACVTERMRGSNRCTREPGEQAPADERSCPSIITTAARRVLAQRSALCRISKITDDRERLARAGAANDANVNPGL